MQRCAPRLAVRSEGALQRDSFDDNVERNYQMEICMWVKVVDVLDRFWTRLTDRGFFALGIAVGAFSTILVLIAAGRMPDWFQRILSHEERIAEWLLVAFTVFAFFILLATLKTTREVGNAQVTAYISLNVTKVLIEKKSGEIVVSVHAKIENSGNSPAYEVRVGYNITQPAKGDVMEVTYDIDKIGHVATPHPLVPQKSEFHGVTLTRKMKYVPNSEVRFLYMIEFKNVFGEIKTSPIISGVLSKHPANSGRFVFVPDKVSTVKLY